MRGAAVPVTLLLVWELASRLGLIASEAFSRPSEILIAAFWALIDGRLLFATFQTLQSAAIGVLLAILIGVLLGLSLGLSSLARLTLSPTLDTLCAVPPVALIPLALLIFGFGISLEATVVAFACVWPIAIATAAAARSLESRLAEVALVLEMTTAIYVRKIVLPAALVRIAVGVRVAIGIALVVAVTVEIVVNPRGLGHSMVMAQQMLRPDLVYAQLFWIGAVGWLLNWLLLRLDRTFLGQFSVTGGAA